MLEVLRLGLAGHRLKTSGIDRKRDNAPRCSKAVSAMERGSAMTFARPLVFETYASIELGSGQSMRYEGIGIVEDSREAADDPPTAARIRCLPFAFSDEPIGRIAPARGNRGAPLVGAPTACRTRRTTSSRSARYLVDEPLPAGRRWGVSAPNRERTRDVRHLLTKRVDRSERAANADDQGHGQRAAVSLAVELEAVPFSEFSKGLKVFAPH